MSIIKYVGVNDRWTELFERQYILGDGISYNSYILEDEKITIMDTVDNIGVDEWINKVEKALGEKIPTYLVVSHLEPDHSAGINAIVEKYPKIKIVLSKKAKDMLSQFTKNDLSESCIVVEEGEVLDLGYQKLQFIMAPMVHWPEVMVTYEQKNKILFSADAFGKFGALDVAEDWDEEARRYYFNIVGKYGMQVQALLKKISTFDIQAIFPLHGPVLNDNLEYYINKYDIWSSYKAEDKGILVVYNTMHGNTERALKKFVTMLRKETDEEIEVRELIGEDMAEVVANAFRYDKMIIASPTYDGGLFPETEKFLRTLKSKNYQNRKVGIIENGSWAPISGKQMKDMFNEMKNISICNQVITIKTSMNDKNIEEMKELIKEITE